ncbi:MAG: porphobilinogen synthase [Methanobrevibacter sp.]|jgi:porphobilinogen synthase|nr:porphobilinogen synthase [Methanobrevibacter sp.]
MNFPIRRMRRLRKSPQIREIFRETKLNKEDLIYPLFVKKGLKNGEKEEIATMPDEFRYSVDDAVKYAKKLESKGLKAVIIFGMPLENEKDEVGSPAYDKYGIVQETIRKLKKETNLVVISDVCLCQYTSHGHCGIVKTKNMRNKENIENEILNDESLKYLAKIAISHAEAGADIVAPSDMMDGRVIAIREALDNNGHENTLIMSYSAKYASSFYYPFRDAVCSTPSFGDRKSYQMDPCNSKEAIQESELDVMEGADVLMVKPALAYLDIIKDLKNSFNHPIAAYNVSGEYSMLKSAIANGYLTEEAIMESLISIKRAGADLIITHFAKDILDDL